MKVSKPPKKFMIEAQERCLPRERYEYQMKYMPCLDDDQSLAMRQDAMRKGFDICNEMWDELLNGKLVIDPEKVSLRILKNIFAHNVTNEEIATI